MHVMRRLKSIASGRSSVSDPGGDAGIKRAKFEQEAEVEDLGSSTVVAGTSEASEQHMAFVSVESSVAGDAGTSNVAAVPKTANTGVDQLPKEMHEMKIRDDKVDNPDEKEIEATVVNGNGTETGHIIATTIGGRNGQPKQVFHKRMPPEAVDLVSRLLQYSPNLRCTALEACVHPFFDELRDPNTHLPNGRPLPPLFNFKLQELKGAAPELIQRLIPEHARKHNPLLSM